MVEDDWTAEITDTMAAGEPDAPSARRGGKRAHLVGLLGAGAGKRFPVEQLVVIGRDVEADVRLEARDLSRRHARISRTEAGDYLLEDLGSANGTLVNNLRVSTQVLGFGDIIQLGYGTSFVFTHPDPLEQLQIGAQHVGSVTQLAGGIAHHFNNLMAVLQSNLAYLDGLPGDQSLGDEAIQDCLADLKSAARQASLVTRQLVGFARLGKYEDRPVDVSSLVLDVVSEARQQARGVTVDAQVQPDLATRGDGSQLRQALSNLCHNAEEALGGSGRLAIRARELSQDPDGEIPQAVIEITVHDSGTGMDPETRRRAFEPFYTTKQPHSATGLGLPAVYGIVKNHGGRVRMETDPGSGTAFYVYLPATGQIAADGTAGAVPDPNRPTPATVLIAESDGTARRELAGLLQELGYQAISAESGRQAILRFLEGRESIRAAILGRDMPGLSGVETARLLRRMQPKLPVLLSGHPTGQEAQTLRDADAQGMVTRPFRPTIVGTALSQLIEATKTPTHQQAVGPGLSQVPTATEKPGKPD